MDFKEIGYISRGALELGKLRIQADGLAFKSLSSGKVVHVKHSDIDLTEWLRVARGYEVKVLSREGNVFKFNGFKESDFEEIKDFFKQHFGKDLKPVELCVKGWNWGEPVFKGSLLTFLIDSKPAFEIPLEEVSRVTSGKNEVALEFHQSETAAVSLVEMRFHIPTGTDGEDDPVQNFHDRVLAKADVIQATGDAIASFSEMQCLTPRGRYTIKVYPTFLGAHGKTFDYKIPFTTITRFFLLPHNDQRQLYLVLGLDPPIRQGQTRYPFFILQMQKDETCEVTLAMSEDELKEKYEGKLNQELKGPLYEVFARLMRVLVGKKMIVPGSFRNNNNQHAISCSCKATSGFLYPLDKGFIFVHKPAIFIKFEDISMVNFARMASAGVSRSFDFEVETRDGSVYHFSSLMKDDYGKLYNFVNEKNLRIKNKAKTQVSYNDEVSSASSDEHDAYLERMKAEGENVDSEDEDSDFVAKESGSDDALEFDSDAKVSDQDSNEEVEEKKDNERGKKRTKEQPKTKPAKKKKEEPSSSGKKKQRAKKDPGAPKKPLSAYFLWLQEMRPTIKKNHPGISVAEVAKKGGEMWKGITDKSKWETEAKRLKEQYKIDVEKYKASEKAGVAKISPSKKEKKVQKGKMKSAAGPGSGSKYKSEEFIASDEDESSDEERKKKSSQTTKDVEMEEEESEPEMSDEDDESD